MKLTYFPEIKALLPSKDEGLFINAYHVHYSMHHIPAFGNVQFLKVLGEIGLPYFFS